MNLSHMERISKIRTSGEFEIGEKVLAPVLHKETVDEETNLTRKLKKVFFPDIYNLFVVFRQIQISIELRLQRRKIILSRNIE